MGKYGKREIFPISSSERLSDAIIHGIPDWIYEGKQIPRLVSFGFNIMNQYLSTSVEGIIQLDKEK